MMGLALERIQHNLRIRASDTSTVIHRVLPPPEGTTATGNRGLLRRARCRSDGDAAPGPHRPLPSR